MKKRILAYIVIAQMIVIAVILYSLLFLKSEKKVSINPFESDFIRNKAVNGLKHFYESKPNTTPKIGVAQLKALGYPPETKVRYLINNDGLNKVDDFQASQSGRKVFKIVAIGDSYTFGAYVNTEDNYPSQLQEMLNNKCQEDFEVFNLGMPGYDLRYAVARYKLRGVKYDPDLVLWLFIEDDFRRINEKQRPKVEAVKREILRRGEDYTSNSLSILWKKAQDEVIREEGGIENILKLQSKYLVEIDNVFKKKLVLFTYEGLKSDFDSLLTRFSESRPDTYKTTVSEISISLGERLFDNHPSAKGYSIMVEELFNYLHENKLIQCSK